MSSPVSFSGFNQIDFTSILNAVMEQERAPVRALEAQQKTLTARTDAYAKLAARLSAIESAAGALADAQTLVGRSATSTDPTALGVTAAGSGLTGTYDIVIQELARAQVTASGTTATAGQVVASGGTLTIGGVDVAVTGDVTLDTLTAQINSTADIAVRASVVTVGADQYKLVLTGKNTGVAGGFSIANGLTGGAGLSFAANAVEASDAHVLVNNIAVTSGSNTVANAIPGATLTLQKKDPDHTVTVTVSRDWDGLRARIATLTSAYNDFVKFTEDQIADAAAGKPSLSNDATFRSLKSAVRSVVMREYGSGDFNALARVGIETDRTGRLQFKRDAFDAAIEEAPDSVEALFAGTGGVPGLFDELVSAVKEYTRTGGVLYDSRQRIDEQVQSLGRRIDDLEARLAVRRLSLQQEFIAADLAMSRMNSQMQSISSLGGEYRLF